MNDGIACKGWWCFYYKEIVQRRADFTVLV